MFRRRRAPRLGLSIEALPRRSTVSNEAKRLLALSNEKGTEVSAATRRHSVSLWGRVASQRRNLPAAVHMRTTRSSSGCRPATPPETRG
jgi:hypothetical protein